MMASIGQILLKYLPDEVAARVMASLWFTVIFALMFAFYGIVMAIVQSLLIHGIV